MAIQACLLYHYDRFGFGSDRSSSESEYESFLLETLGENGYYDDREDGYDEYEEYYEYNEDDEDEDEDNYCAREDCWTDRDIYDIYNRASQEDCYWLDMSYYTF